MANSTIIIIGVLVLFGGIAQAGLSAMTAYVITKNDSASQNPKVPLSQILNLAYLYNGMLGGGLAIMLTGIALIMLGSGSFSVMGGRR